MDEVTTLLYKLAELAGIAAGVSALMSLAVVTLALGLFTAYAIYKIARDLHNL